MIRGSGSEILNHAYPVVRKVDFRSEMDRKSGHAADMSKATRMTQADFGDHRLPRIGATSNSK
jgi:hypothetical protein